MALGWERFAIMGVCLYCSVRELVREDPFGNKLACKTCWELICYGTEGE